MRCSVPVQFEVIRMGSEFQSQCERKANDINLMQWSCLNGPPLGSKSLIVCKYGKSCAQERENRWVAHILMVAVLKVDFKHFLEYVNIMLEVSDRRYSTRDHTLFNIHTLHVVDQPPPLIIGLSSVPVQSKHTARSASTTPTHTTINTQLFNVSWSAHCVHTYIHRYAT